MSNLPPADTRRRSTPTTAKGLRPASVGLLASMALGLSSVAPAYSIAVTLGFVALTVGDLAPAALLVGFVPILLTAFAFRELNRDMPDCGTTFVWSTRAFGPFTGWLAGGWVVQTATLIAMAALSQVGAAHLLGLLGLDTLAGRPVAVTCTAVLLIALVAVLAYRGIQLAAGAQYLMLGLQLVALLGFGTAALARDGAATPSLAWLNPLAFPDAGAMAEGVVLCLFIYWGWDALLTVNEETTDSTRTPGRAAVLSTLVLLGMYLFTAYAALAYAGPGSTGLGLGNPDTAADVLAALAPPVLGEVLAKAVQLAVCVSAVAALLSCLVSSPRGTLSMAAHGALPPAFARIHPRFRTPAFGTVCWAAATTVVLAALTALSTDFLGDAILSLGLLIAFYYAVTGFACAWHFRAQLRRSPSDLLLKGVLPGIGAAMMLAAFARCAYDMTDPAYGSTSVAGIGGVFLLGVGSIALGALVALAVRPRFRRFFRDGRTTITQLTVTED
ncbi:APC family permease [Streptomyces aquilus]|uniref:APC family permease n=1 Tax=Streptomyces aquilus TaxID=2548456 RepID=UPI0036BBD3F3